MQNIHSKSGFCKCCRSILLLLGCMYGISNAHAENKKDAAATIEAGLSAYRAGELGKATQQLSYALQLINDKYGELIIDALPPALPGWKAEKARHQMSPIMLGGGVTVSRNYKHDNARVSLQLVKDSPLLQSLHMVMTNPSLLGLEGGKLKLIKGNNAIVKFNESNNRGELSLIVENRFLILIKSSYTSLENMLQYAETINFDMLKKLVN